MKFSFSLPAILAAAAICFTTVLAAPSSSYLDRRAADSVPSHMKGKAVFYRAITGSEIPRIGQVYPLNKSPTGHSSSGGDFSPSGRGGLYVFDNLDEAMFFGKCYTTGIPKPLDAYYIVTLGYTPSKKTAVKSFTKPSSDWEKFVNDNYANKAHKYNIVEGPYSRVSKGKKVGAMQQDNVNMLWQGIFIGPEALKTLTVLDVKKISVRPGGSSMGCRIL
ncbi:hypothetical protein ONZ45_g13839 [Pleurotus djamor]|nr:hypothetical protein ONZ45_g17285 [Pleurotus djamor]KAJ8488752.1 hypothetical protein ONZ45_g13839 [Pleurotus djamor]